MLKIMNPLDYPTCFDRPLRLDGISAWVEHTPFAMFLIEAFRPKVFVELGSHTGVSYCAFCQAIKKNGLDTRAYAVDTWEGDKHAGYYDTHVLSDLRAYHDPLYGGFSRLVQSTFDDAVSSFPDGSIDLLHIDGLHTYEAVKHDFDTWSPKLSKNAIVLFHDINVRERGFGVWQLWDELKSKYPAFDFIHGHGLGVLCVGDNPPPVLQEFFSATDAQAEALREFFFSLGSKYSSEAVAEAVSNEKDRTIRSISLERDEKQAVIVEREKLIEELNESIHGLKDTIGGLNDTIGGLNDAINQRQNLLNEIFSSVGWRFLVRLRQIKEIFAPAGSIQARLIRASFKAFYVLRTEGLRSLIRKVFGKLSALLRRAKRSPVSSVSSVSSATEYVPIIQSSIQTDSLQVKAIAFYLPQFHPIPENDAWWGKGFTEWTNVSKAVPNFSGHYQPRLPGDLGFYDLRLKEVQEQQVELAKKYGVYGFCFYYYWFAGKRLLERPLDQYLANPDLDLPFCLCWANENWTRRWDGAENDILIGQVHSEDEYHHFIRDIAPNFLDPRYIRVDGKPMLLVYRINLLPDPSRAAEIWREECRRMGIGEIYLGVIQSFGIKDPRSYGFDAAIEFPPHHLGQAEIGVHNLKGVHPEFRGRIFDYGLAARTMMNKQYGEYTVFKTVMPSWDNTARKQKDSHIFVNSSPSAYKAWLENAVEYTRRSLPESKRFVFINAWNEWAEGTYLEPDRKYGYAYLQATAEALTGKSGGVSTSSEASWTLLFVSHDANRGGAQLVLLNMLAWFKKYTSIRLKVICLYGGEWLPQFQSYADTIVWSDLRSGASSDDHLIDLVRQFCEGTPDLIYGNTVVSGAIYEVLSGLNVPILTHFHEMEMSIDRYGKQSIGQILKHSAHYIACSEAVKDNLVKNHAVAPRMISTVYSAVVPHVADKIFLDESEKKKARKRLGLEPDKLIVFGCGIGMVYRKGADLFIETARALRNSGVKDFHFYWIGEFAGDELNEDGKAWKDHLRELRKEGMDDHVTFLGLKKNVRDYLSAGDLFLLPSREDPFPLVALEAAECGLPIICFDRTAGGMSDFVLDDAGVVVPLLDIDAMASAVDRLKNDRDLRVRLGARAREKFLTEFTVDHLTPHILSVCRKIAGKKPAVSVIVPNYNHEKYLASRLDSIFNQTFRDFEVILLDDASTDGSLGVLERYSTKADVTLVKNERNTGSPFAQWLKGIDMSSSDIIWIAESDDLSDPHFLRKLLPAFHDPAVKLAFANSNVIDENGVIVGDYIGTDYLTSLSHTKWSSSYKIAAENEINDGLGVKNTILNISSVLLRRFDVSEDVRAKLVDMRVAGDWYLIVLAIKGGLVFYDVAKLNYHRRHSESVVGQTVKNKKVELFFTEYFEVQQVIKNNYQLHPQFNEKREEYLRKQWFDFCPGEAFEAIERYRSDRSSKDGIVIAFGESGSGNAIRLIQNKPVLIHQMGKVGSKSVEVSLKKAYSNLQLPVPIYHIHILNDFDNLRKEAISQRVDPTDFLSAIEQGENLRNQIDGKDGLYWNIVSLVRDPVARNVGTFFHNLPDFIPDWREKYHKGNLDVNYLMEFFLGLDAIHDWPEYWFDAQLKLIPSFNIDVYAEKFPYDLGYKIYSGSAKADLLILRLEDLGRCVKPAMLNFLGIENFVLHSVNIGEEKEYSEVYKDFKKLPLPVEYVQRLYNTKFARHFYTEEELKFFAKKWTHTK